MEPESTPVVPANRLLEVARLLSDAATRLHVELGELPAERRQAVLDAVVEHVGDVVRAWSELVQSVVSVESPRAAVSPASRAASPQEETSEAQPFPPSRIAVAEEPPGPLVPGAQPRRAPISAAPRPRPRTTVSATERQTHATQGLRVRRTPEDDTATEAGLDVGSAASTAGSPSEDGYPHDELTGVLNRQSGYAAIDRDIERCRREGQHLVLGYLNVDGMREINQSGGPRAGDELLRKVAAGLRATLRSYDVIMRLAGDEFLFSLPGADVTTAEKRMREFGLILGEDAPGASVSVGFAHLQPGDSVDALVARADDALVQARRRRGRRRLR